MNNLDMSRKLSENLLFEKRNDLLLISNDNQARCAMASMSLQHRGNVYLVVPQIPMLLTGRKGIKKNAERSIWHM